MREDPDIIKMLREEERLGILTSMSQESVEGLETPGEVFEDMSDKNIVIFEEKTEKRGIEDNLVIEIKKEKRKSGITVIGDVSWGTHLCQFYQTKEDLIDILVPYFKAGLENNEFCMWVTSEPLHVEDAKTALGKVMKDLDGYIKKGQIEILDYSEWYTKTGGFDADRVLKGWVEKEKQALKNGFDGLRLTGNTFWLEKKDWKKFTDYEQVVNSVIGEHRMLAICAYCLDKCDASEIIDVVSNHQFALIPHEGEWKIIESSEWKKAEETLRESEEKFRTFVDTASDLMSIADKDGNFTDVNEAMTRALGYSKEELSGMRIPQILTKEYLENNFKPNWKKFVTNGEITIETTFVTKNGKEICGELKAVAIYDSDGKFAGSRAIFYDLTERKKAEGEIKNLAKFPSENPRPVLRITKDGTVVYSNNAGFQILDFWKTNIGGKVSEHWCNIIRKKFASQNLKAEEEEEEEEEEVNDKIFSFVVAPVADEGYVNFYGRDITERKKAEEKIKESEAQLSNAVKIAHLGAWEYDVINDIFTFNDPFYAIFRTTAKQVGGYTMSSADYAKRFVHPEDASVVGLEVRKAIETDDPNFSRQFDHRIIYPDGEVGYISVRFFIVKDEKGKTIRTYGANQDITKYKQAEETLKISENNYKTIFNSASDAIFVHSIPDMKIVDVNDETCKRYGYTKEEIKKLTVDELSSPEFSLKSPRNQKLLQSVMNGDTVNSEWLSKRKNGELFWHEMTGKIIELNGENHFLSMAKDIDEIKKHQRKIEQQNVQLKKLDRIKTDFLNTTSHELRTPMAAIKGYIQMLLKQTLGDVTPEQKDALNVILRNTDRLDHLVQDILDISRLDSGTMKFIPEKTDITKVIKEVVETMQLSANVKNIKINTELEEMPELVIDQERIKQVIMNLVDNAIKFSPHDYTINLRTKIKKDGVLFEVQDFGRGIPRNKQKKIFERFYQVDSGMDRKFGGAGLGLAISRGIVNAHDGKIWADSTLGKGSSFKFSLPLQSIKDIKDGFKKEMDIFALENNK